MVSTFPTKEYIETAISSFTAVPVPTVAVHEEFGFRRRRRWRRRILQRIELLESATNSMRF
jgi:hypothetical protein